MRKRTLLIVLVGLIPAAFILSRLGFDDSLHATRAGKNYFYTADRGGFEKLTGIPMSALPCEGCHAATYANGDPVDGASYSPDCKDCHDFAGAGTNVPDNVCIGCHSRQGAENTLAASANPTLAAMFADVHRDAGMECTDCHTKDEFPVVHGASTTIFQSMLEPGAKYAACDNSGCHETVVANTAHDTHSDYVECSACHAKSVVTCYNCHFESEVDADIKRFYGKPPMNGFVLLVNDTESGKVTTASLQSLVYGDTTFYAIAPFHGHTITRDARTCTDCHDSEIIRGYNSTGSIPVVQWDSDQSVLVNTKGTIPVPPDWSTALLFDFVTYTGDVTDPFGALDPAKWRFLKSGADLTQMLSEFSTPLTADQMAKLSTNVVVGTDDEPAVPSTFRLEQNYPNPFNPATTIRYSVPRTEVVTIEIFDLVGKEIETLFVGERAPGTYDVKWNAANEPSGVYLYRLRAGDFEETKSMLLVK